MFAPTTESPVCVFCRSALDAWDTTEVWGELYHAQFDIRESIAQGCCICLVLFNTSSQQSERLKKLDGEGQSYSEDNESFIWYTKFPSDASSNRLSLQVRFERSGGYWRVDRNFSLILVEAGDSGEQRATNLIGDETGSIELIPLVSKWFRSCSSHDDCRRESSTFVPSRLIDVGQNDNSRIRLRLRSDYAQPLQATYGPGESYVTLSHCWGGVNPSQLDSSNLESLLHDIPLESLPTTFQHAVTITRLLGVRYLWIDSLCIIQDSIDDWRVQSAFMNVIYWCGFCNISATAARNGFEGLFFQRDPNASKKPLVSIDVAQSHGLYKVFEDTIWEDQVINSPLNKRSWVCQERILSRRNLHFGSKQLFWECSELSACEQLPNGDHGGIFYSGAYIKQDFITLIDQNDPASLHQKLEIWGDIVLIYTQGSLTYLSDKLVAIGGLAMMVQDALKCNYLAGLWEKELPRQLLWTRRGSGQSADQYIAPSWSWASIDGPVWYVFAAGPEDNMDNQHIDIQEETTELIEIMEAKVEQSTAYEFGQVIGGFLRIRGKPILGRLDQESLGLDMMRLETGSGELTTTLGVIWDHDRYAREVDQKERWILLPILRIFLPGALDDSNALVRGIVLKLTGGSVTNELRRCGQFQFYVAESDCSALLTSGQAVFRQSPHSFTMNSSDVDDKGDQTYVLRII